MSWFQDIQKQEIDLIIYLQKVFFKNESTLGYFSTLYGSAFMYVFIIPCLAAFNTKLYHKALSCCLISDFLNLILKWILNEDRPYWWIHETKAYTSLTRPTLYQTERTCETSPGSPSGHLMIASSFLFVILIGVEKLIVLNFMSYRRPLRYLARTIFAFILMVLAVSRMYFATHFLHQCILGAWLGICVSEIFSFMKYREAVQAFEKVKWFKIGCAMAVSVTSIFWMYKMFNGNPMESVQLAFKYCADPLYPKPETTVIFSSIRIIAKIAGLMLAAPLKNIASPDLKMNLIRSVPLTSLLIFIQHQLILNTPTTYKIIIFYSYTFAVYATFQYLFIAIIPKLCAQKSERPKTN